MPTYEYQCQSCNHRWELEQKINDEPACQCPSCDSDAAKRLISNGNFVLKGNTWYRDGYASKP